MQRAVKLSWENLSRLMTKPTKWPVYSAKTQVSLGIPPFWSASSLSAWRSSRYFHRVPSEDWLDWADAQADLSLCWVHNSFCWFCHGAAQIWLQSCATRYRKFSKYSDTQKMCCNHSNIWTMWLYHRVMSPNDEDGMANSVAVWSGSALFAQAYLSENLGSLR